MAKQNSFKIVDFFNAYVREIEHAQKTAATIHSARNIRASGDSVEEVVRSVITRQIPDSYYTTQGQIIDASLEPSNQFDVIIADYKGSPVLFKSGNTDYLCYESIYAVGEVKTSFQTKHLQEFIDKIKRLNHEFKREKTSIFQVTQDFKLGGNTFGDARSEEGWSYKNPLFKFMFIANSGKINLQNTLEFLEVVNPIDAPNIIILLDKGIIVNGKMKMSDKLPNIEIITPTNINVQFKLDVENVRLYPEFTSKNDADVFKWTFIEFTDKSASNLAYLVYTLNYHLSKCIVLKPNLVEYHSQLFTGKNAQWSMVTNEEILKLAETKNKALDKKSL